VSVLVVNPYLLFSDAKMPVNVDAHWIQLAEFSVMNSTTTTTQ